MIKEFKNYFTIPPLRQALRIRSMRSSPNPDDVGLLSFLLFASIACSPPFRALARFLLLTFAVPDWDFSATEGPGVDTLPLSVEEARTSGAGADAATPFLTLNVLALSAGSVTRVPL